MSFQGADPIAFESVSAVTQTASVKLGARRIVDGEEYVYAYNDTGSAATQGALMIASGCSGYSLTRSSTASADFPVCAVKHADLAAGDYFWGITRGKCSMMSLAMTKGLLVGVGADGALKTFLTATFATGACIGKALDTSTASSRPECLIKLFG